MMTYDSYKHIICDLFITMCQEKGTQTEMDSFLSKVMDAPKHYLKYMISDFESAWNLHSNKYTQKFEPEVYATCIKFKDQMKEIKNHDGWKNYFNGPIIQALKNDIHGRNLKREIHLLSLEYGTDVKCIVSK